MQQGKTLTGKDTKQREKVLDRLNTMGIFNVKDAERAGLSRATLSRMVKAGSLQSIAVGVYKMPGMDIDPNEQDFIVACMRCGPDAAIGGITALFHYGFIDEVPDRIWLVVPPTVRSANSGYRLLRSQHSPRLGVIRHKRYRIVSPERAILEALRYSSKIGEGMAIGAARRALKGQHVARKTLYDLAKRLGLTRVLENHWEAISSP